MLFCNKHIDDQTKNCWKKAARLHWLRHVERMGVDLAAKKYTWDNRMDADR